MSEKISKISVDGVVYDLSVDTTEFYSKIEQKVSEEATAREEGDAQLQKNIESEAARVDGMINQVNENVASSIEALNNNLVQAIETINGGIAAEVINREEGDAKLQAAIDDLAGKISGEGADITELEGKVEKNAADIKTVAENLVTVNENLANSINTINQNMVDGFNTINGGLDNEIRPELEKAVKYEDTATEQNPGRKSILLANHDNILGAKTDGSAVNIAMVSKWDKVDLGSGSVEINLNGSAERPTYNDTEEIALIKDLEDETTARGEADTKLQEDLQTEATTARAAEKANADAIAAEVTRATEKEAEIEANLAEATKDVVKHQVDSLGKEVIALSNDEQILAAPNKEELEGKIEVEGSVPLIKLNKWNVVDLGSPKTLLNINTPDGVRPTVQEKSQSGPKANQIAYVSDVNGLSNVLEALGATVQILQEKVDALTKTNTEVVNAEGSITGLTDATKDYIVSGSINEKSEITGKSISLKNVEVSNDARLKLKAGDIEAKSLNISGAFPKASGNSVVNINDAEFIVFKDMVFDASEVYNGIEIGLAKDTVLPKNILFDNCKFLGEFSNNAILVFGTQDNAVITLNNCHFDKISNALRLSNKSNASGVVVNINNCTVDQWETRAPWQGFLICEDYTSKTEEEANANNLFGDGKIIVNFNNLIHGGVKVNPADPASVCGTKNDDQVVMVCQDSVAGPDGDYCLSYDAAKFPVVSFK